MSEKSRIYYSSTPPEDWGQFIYGVSLKQENCEIKVDMTPGLNVVIGGSSSGKTLFVDSIVRKLKNTYSESQYIDFGIDKLNVINPSSVVPHYINQNFIINVLQNSDLNLGGYRVDKGSVSRGYDGYTEDKAKFGAIKAPDRKISGFCSKI